jgi:hypothetical protein
MAILCWAAKNSLRGTTVTQIMNDKIILTPTNIKISSSELYFFVCLVLHCKEGNVCLVVFCLSLLFDIPGIFFRINGLQTLLLLFVR